jgi:hypothetical protein
MITVPSPPGRWKALRSARAHMSARTPATTTKIAASTNEYTPKALLASSMRSRRLLTLAKPVSWYHGSSIESSSANAATATRRCSLESARQLRPMRDSTPLMR